MLVFEDRKIQLADSSNVMVTKVTGAVDGNTVREFEEKLLGFFNSGFKRLIINFSEVQYINSTGMGLLVKMVDKFKAEGGNINLVNIPKKVLALFDLLGLLSLIKVAKSEEEALSSLSELVQPPESAQPQVKASPQTQAPPAIKDQPPVPQVKVSPQIQTPLAKKVEEVKHNPPKVPAKAPQAKTPPQIPNEVKVQPKSTAAAQPPTVANQPKRSTTTPKHVIIQCVNCKKKISLGTAPRAGSYKCPKCTTLFRVFKNKQIRFYKKKKVHNS